MPEPTTSHVAPWLQQAGEVASYIALMILSALGGWLGKAKKAQTAAGADAPMDGSSHVADIRAALLIDKDSTGHTVVEQWRLLFRFLSTRDGDGNYVSLVRVQTAEYLGRIASAMETQSTTMATQTAILGRLEHANEETKDRLHVIEETLEIAPAPRSRRKAGAGQGGHDGR